MEILLRRYGNNKGGSWKQLTVKQSRMIQILYSQGYRQKDIAEKFGIAQSGVSRICKKKIKTDAT
jgi:DNA-binding MarR family transcriptional regulator